MSDLINHQVFHEVCFDTLTVYFYSCDIVSMVFRSDRDSKELKEKFLKGKSPNLVR